MPQPSHSAPSAEDRDRAVRRPAPAVGRVPFALVLLSLVLVLIPSTRPGGLALVLVLAVPAIVVWFRARNWAMAAEA